MPDKIDQDLQSLRIDRTKKGDAGRMRWWGLVLVLLLLAVLVAVVLAFVPERIGLSGFGSQAREVQVESAERRAQVTTDVALTASGYVIPRRRVEVSSKISGRV